MKKYLMIAVAATLLFGCKKKAARVVVEKVDTHTIVETVSAIGKIYPELEVKISSDVSGEIIDIFINEGDSVKRGQLLAKINPDLYESGLDQAQAGFQNAKSQQSSSAANLARINGVKRFSIYLISQYKVL